MRVIPLATTILIALAMSAAQPTLAADRTVQTLEEEREMAALTVWIAEVEQTWLGYVLTGAGGQLLWTPPILPADEETTSGKTKDVSARDRRSRVILEDGAPF
jgi:arylamine N-acetyltransferase